MILPKLPRFREFETLLPDSRNNTIFHMARVIFVAGQLFAQGFFFRDGTADEHQPPEQTDQGAQPGA